MIWQKLKIKQLIAVLLVLSFVLPFAKIAKAADVPQAPPEVYPGGAPPSDTGGGIWSWLGSSAACLGGLGIGAGSAGAGTAATVAGCAGLAGKITKFLGGDAGGWLSKGLGMGLDAIAKSVRKNVLSKLYKKMLDYISGEGGQVLDWGDMASDSANEAAGLLLDQIAKATINPDIDLCNPWDDFGPATNETTAFFKLILGKQAPEEQWSCKASEIKKAGKAFFENFEGGWDAWLEVSTKPMANPYGQYLWAIENQNALIDKLTKEKTDQAIAGGGYIGQEKIMQWHIIAEPFIMYWEDYEASTDSAIKKKCSGDETGVEYNCQGGVVKLDSCPSECSLDTSLSYCVCSDGVGFNDLKNHYGLAEDDRNRLTAGTMPEICQTIHQQGTYACYLVVDRKELFTPGRLFADAASNILLKDVRAAESGDVDILEYYTAKLLDDIFGALTTRGIRGLSNLLKPDAEQEGDGFHITSRREQINALEEEGAFEALKSTYEETLLALNSILDKQQELKMLLSTGIVNNDLKTQSKEFYYCAMNKCAEQEYNDCAKFYPEDLNQNCVFTKCTDPCFASPDAPTLEECKKKCADKPPAECMSQGSDGAECVAEGFDFCVNPKLPGPVYDNPQVQKTYEFYANITSYGTSEQRTEMIDRVDYGGFFDDCKQKGFESSALETCFNQKLAGLVDIDQFIIWDKSLIEDFKRLGEEEIAPALRDCTMITQVPGNTLGLCDANGCDNIKEYCSYYSGKYQSKAFTIDFWEAQLKNDISIKDRFYKNGLDAYRYLVAKRKLFRNVYSTKHAVPNTDVCQNGCDLEKLANLLSGKKQALALKMDTFNKNAYKTEWENKAKELEQEKTKTDPDESLIAQLENDLKKIKTNSSNLNDEIQELNDDITALQEVYDQTTEELVAMLTEIDSIINATKIDEQSEEAKNFMGEGYVETLSGRKNWLTVEKDKIMKYTGSLKCNLNEISQKPIKPSSTPPPAAP